MHKLLATETLLRLGVSFAFLYPAVSAWFNPYAWIGYMPAFLLDLSGQHDMLLLHLFGALEIALAIWIMIGRNILIPSVIAAGILALIILFNFTQMDVLFRDVPILFMTVALALMQKRAGFND